MKQKATGMENRERVILDTDIGTDIDDSWALGLLTRSPELTTDLILTTSGDTGYRAALAGRFLRKTGGPAIPVGRGLGDRNDPRYVKTLEPCLRGDDRTGFLEDGLAEAIRIIESGERTTIIAIGPLTDLAWLCDHRPDLLGRIRVVAMAGSIERGLRDQPGKIAEYNVTSDLEAARTVFSAPWREFILSPVDHCGDLVLTGALYRQIVRADTPLTRELVEEYRTWLRYTRHFVAGEEKESSVLFDTAAVHLAITTDDSIMKTLKLVVDAEGFLRESAEGRPVRVATGWKNREAFLQSLVDRLVAVPF